MNAFVERLASASQINNSLLCIGLDPDPRLMDMPDVLEFNKAIIAATKDLVCAYKPNLSFYEALGLKGLDALEKTISYIRDVAPSAILIGDGKRGDIGSTNEIYAKALFEAWDFDAATVNGFAGTEAMEPYFQYQDRGVFVWCRSSNPGASELQDQMIASDEGHIPVYEWIAKQAGAWNKRGNVGLVVGATYTEELRIVRRRCPGMPILIPGVGAQGGDLESSIKCGLDRDQIGVIISSSRGIIYASREAKNCAEAARTSAENLRNRINRILISAGREW